MSHSELQRLEDALSSASETHATLTRDVAAAHDAAALSEVLNRHGYDISKDELERLNPAGELSSRELEGVAGGMNAVSSNAAFSSLLKVKKPII